MVRSWLPHWLVDNSVGIGYHYIGTCAKPCRRASLAAWIFLSALYATDACCVYLPLEAPVELNDACALS